MYFAVIYELIFKLLKQPSSISVSQATKTIPFLDLSAIALIRKDHLAVNDFPKTNQIWICGHFGIMSWSLALIIWTHS